MKLKILGISLWLITSISLHAASTKKETPGKVAPGKEYQVTIESIPELPGSREINTLLEQLGKLLEQLVQKKQAINVEDQRTRKEIDLQEKENNALTEELRKQSLPSPRQRMQGSPETLEKKLEGRRKEIDELEKKIQKILARLLCNQDTIVQELVAAGMIEALKNETPKVGAAESSGACPLDAITRAIKMEVLQFNNLRKLRGEIQAQNFEFRKQLGKSSSSAAGKATTTSSTTTPETSANSTSTSHKREKSISSKPLAQHFTRLNFILTGLITNHTILQDSYQNNAAQVSTFRNDIKKLLKENDELRLDFKVRAARTEANIKISPLPELTPIDSATIELPPSALEAKNNFNACVRDLQKEIARVCEELKSISFQLVGLQDHLKSLKNYKALLIRARNPKGSSSGTHSRTGSTDSTGSTTSTGSTGSATSTTSTSSKQSAASASAQGSSSGTHSRSSSTDSTTSTGGSTPRGTPGMLSSVGSATLIDQDDDEGYFDKKDILAKSLIESGVAELTDFPDYAKKLEEHRTKKQSGNTSPTNTSPSTAPQTGYRKVNIDD